MGCGSSGVDFVKKQFNSMKNALTSGFAQMKEQMLQIQNDLKMKKINQKLKKNKQAKQKAAILSAEEQENMQGDIQGGNTVAVMGIIRSKNTSCKQDIGSDGYNWNVLHFACQSNKGNLVHNLLYDAYSKGQDVYQSVINSETFEGYTPSMICSMYDSNQALAVLLDGGGVDLAQFSEGTMANTRQMAKSYQSAKCLQILSNFTEDKLVPINASYFDNKPEEINEEKSKEEQQTKQIKEEQEKKKKVEFDMQKEKEQRKKKELKEEEQMRKKKEAEIEALRVARENYQREMDELQRERERIDKENREAQQQRKKEIADMESQAKKEQDEAAQKETEAKREEMMKAQKEAMERNQKAQEEAQKLASDKKAQMEREEQEKLEQMAKNERDRLKAKEQKKSDQSLFSQYLEKLKSEDGVFQDQDFPHTCKSITGKDSYPENQNFDKALWLRPHEILKCNYDQIQLYENGIDPNDIQQGGLGVCYFLCILSALAEYPERVKKLFVNQESNKYGLYSIVIYVDGKQKEILIDDYIPCDKNSQRPLFSRVNGKELWAILMEQVWAKTFQYYLKAEASSPHYAMEELTGCPSDFFNLDDFEKQELFDKILDWDKRKYLFGLSSRTDSNQEELGIVGGHAYTLIGAYKIGNVKLLKCRNPWGNHEWKGKYGDEGKLWNDDLKKQVGFVAAEDGIFFVDLDEFYFAFDGMSIGYFRDDYIFSSIPIVLPHQQDKYYKFILEQDGELNIRLHQKYEKRLEIPNFEYSRGDFDLFQLEDDGTVTQVCNGNGWNAKSVNMCVHKGPVFLDLKKGTYAIKINWVLWNDGKTPESTSYNLSTYFKVMTPLVEMSEMQVKTFTKNQVLSQAQTYARAPAKNCPTVNEGKGWDDSCNFFFVFENLGENTQKVTVNLGKSKGLAFPNQASSFELNIEPGELDFVVAENQNKGSGGQVSLSYTIRYG